jgi:simple sugar transport system ATP-binding protein
MRGIGKRFGAVRANRDVDLTLLPGDILGLLGENGAGKTTLMNILFGSYSPDEGRIEIDGQPVEIHNSAAAIAHGVGMVHQHFHLVPRHTVLENLLVGRKGRRGLLDNAAAVARLEEIGRHFQLFLEPDRRVGDLTIGEQQRLEIIKALFSGARILILDEPTAALTPQEADGLFDALRAMAAEGMGVIFISHKLHEVRAITSHVMVMRLGEVVANLENAPEVSQAHLAELMCGHELTSPVKPDKQPGRSLLHLRDAVTDAAGRTNLADQRPARTGRGHRRHVAAVGRQSGNRRRRRAASLGQRHAGAGRRPHPRGPHAHRPYHQPAAERQHGAAAYRRGAIQPPWRPRPSRHPDFC